MKSEKVCVKFYICFSFYTELTHFLHVALNILCLSLQFKFQGQGKVFAIK